MRAAALAALAWGSACGGNVVVDGMPDGSGGAGATSSSAITTGAFGSSAISTGVVGPSAVSVGAVSTSATWMTTSGTGTSSSGAGGVEAWWMSLCQAYCQRYTAACGELTTGDCWEHCDSLLGTAPRCNDLLGQFFECALDSRIDCGLVPPQCERLVDGYDACGASDGCATLDCFDGRDRACSCKSACPDMAFAVECRPDRFNTITCSCFVDGEEWATCQDVGPACDVARGCCGPIFDELR